MSRSPHIAVSPKILKWARESLHLSQEAVIKHFNKKSRRRFKLNLDALQRFESEKSEIGLSLLKEFAKLYKRTLTVFFLSEPPKTKGPPKDFRTFYEWTNKQLSPETMLVVRKARNIQEVARELSEELSEDYKFKFNKYQITNKPSELALNFREQFALTWKQQRRISSPGEFFRWLRTKVENSGVFVLKESFPLEDARAFSLADEEPFIIVINSRDGEASYAPKLFSLIHEFSHLLLRQGAICNNFGIASRNIERFCNQFAASFLIPAAFLKKELYQITKEFHLQDIEDYLWKLQKPFKVSKQALLVRFLELGFIESKDYQLKVAEWEREYGERMKWKKKRFAPHVSPHQKALASLGPSFVTRVLEAQREDKLTIDTAAEYLSIKPTYLSKLDLLLEKHGENTVR